MKGRALQSDLKKSNPRRPQDTTGCWLLALNHDIVVTHVIQLVDECPFTHSPVQCSQLA